MFKRAGFALALALTTFGLPASLTGPVAASPAPPWQPAPSPAKPPGPEAFPEPPAAAARTARAQIDSLREAANARERQQAVDRLLEVAPQAKRVLVKELERRHRRTYGTMIYALGTTGDPAVIPILEAQLSRLQGSAYMETLYAMALAGDPGALLRAMRSTYATLTFVRTATAVDFIAGAIGPSAAPLLMQEIPRRAQHSRIAGLRALGTLGDEQAVDFLLHWSKRPSAVDRQFALIALARIGTPRAGGALLAAADDDSPEVRQAAIEGLGYLRHRPAVAKLMSILEEAGPERRTERMRAIWALALIGGPDAATALVEHWERIGEDDRDRVLVVRALGRLGSEAAVPLLTELASGDGVLAVDSARALVEIPGDESRDGLLRVCDGASSLDAGLYAARELVARGDPRAGPCVVARIKEEIESKHRLSPRSEEILDRLPGVARRGAARSLRALAEEVPAPAIAQRLRSCGHEIELTIDLGSDVEPWLELLEEGTPDELELAIRQLGELGDPRAVQPLRHVFGQIDPSKAHLVPQALARIDSDRAVPFLISLLCDELYRVPSLTAARNEAARALVTLSEGQHVASALRRAYLAEDGQLFVPLLALAKLRGESGIDEIVELKKLLLQRRSRQQVLRHERINWALRMIRTGHEIPLEEIKDVR